MRRLLAFILMICLTLVQAGCSSKTSKDDPKNNKETQSGKIIGVETKEPIEGDASKDAVETSAKEIKLIKKPNKTKYLLTNGIEIQRQDKNINISNGSILVSIPKVSGLKDKNLEDALNKAIEKDLEKAIQNYAVEKNDTSTKLASGSLYPIVRLNANNLLSISLNDFYSPPIYGFLYRLTDGKRLYLKDIFTEGTDYEPLINQKVIEGILMKDGEEEGNLSRPFSTIKPDQDFVLTGDTLYMIFAPGEGGFIERNSVGIPLAKIDDYVDVTDRYSGTERKNHERIDLIVRGNNIFTTWKSDIIKKSNGNVWLQYPEISGLRDNAFEDVINSTIKKGIDEASTIKALDALKKGADQEKDCVAIIQASVTFNHYGILCIQRQVYTWGDSTNLQEFNKAYAFDLINKKIIDSKDIIKKYIAGNKEQEGDLAAAVKNSIITIYAHGSNDFKNAVNSKITFSFIMDKGQVYFSNGEDKNNIAIIMCFNGEMFGRPSEQIFCSVPLKTIVKGVPEDFFGW